MKKIFKLKSKEWFQIFKNKKKFKYFNYNNFTFLIIKNFSNHLKFGMSFKKIKLAVDRNKIKRTTYWFLDKEIDKLLFKKKLIFIIIFKPSWLSSKTINKNKFLLQNIKKIIKNYN